MTRRREWRAESAATAEYPARDGDYEKFGLEFLPPRGREAWLLPRRGWGGLADEFRERLGQLSDHTNALRRTLYHKLVR